MFNKQLALTLALAAAAPFALAAPATLTNTTYGIVSANTLGQHPDIPVGAAFEMTTVAHFDTDDVMLGEFDRETAPASDITVTLKAGDSTFVFESGTWGGTLTTSVSNYNGRDTLYFGLDFYEPGEVNHYYVFTGVSWSEGEYSPPLLLSPGANVSYTAPFATNVSFIGRQMSELAGELSLTAQSTHFSVSAVPEPATYGMLFAGMGLIGFMSRRARRVEGGQR